MSVVNSARREASNHPKFGTVALLLAGVAFPATAAGTTSSSAAEQPASAVPEQEIVVTAPPLFRDLQPERDLDQTGIAGYGVSTVDELLQEVEGELGEDEEPLILVNGERINDLDQVGGLPVEVLRNVQVLPRGSAVRVGGASHQRVISLTMVRQARSATVTAASKIATQGDWYGGRGEVILTKIQGSTRMNLTVRARGESSLLESERGIVQPQPRLPYAAAGNVIAYPDLLGEIDPLLSAAAGQIVTVAPVPSTTNPLLSDFIPNANDPAVTDLGQFRTLRPKTRSYDVNGTYSTKLAPWLTTTAGLRLSRNTSRSLRGLPTGLFILSPDNPASPFSTDVALAFYGAEPLHTRSRRDSGEGNLTFDARFGRWTGNLYARHSESKDVTRTERQDVFGAIALDDSINPFSTDLAELIGVRSDRATSRSITNLAQLSFTGPAAKLPAGDLQATIEGRLAGNRLRSSTTSSSNSDRRFSRSEQSIRGAVEIPLTSRDNNFLAAVGDLSASVEYNRIHFSDAGNIDHRTFGLTWEPVPALRLHGTVDKTDRPPSIQLLGNPVIITTDVRVFDPLTSETVDVVQITGGNPSLAPETTSIRRLTGQLHLVPRLNLDLNAEYTDTDVRHFVSSLPDASAVVMLAFPDRFVRDVNGVLTTVDLRPVNFDSHREKRLRYGFSLSKTIGGQGASARMSVSAASEGNEETSAEREQSPATAQRLSSKRAGPPTRVQLSINHTIVFSDEIRIRPGLDTVDLLDGGAIGIAGGRVRHQLDGTAALTSGGMGVRLGATWRGKSTLESRIGTTTDTLRFSPLFLVNIRAFADASRLFGRSNSWARGMRLSLNVLNATNDRQSVRDSLGATPLQYQPGYRDPIGRTVELELRKVF